MVLVSCMWNDGLLHIDVLMTVRSVVEYPRFVRLNVDPIRLPTVRLRLVVVATTRVPPLSALVRSCKLGCYLRNRLVAVTSLARTMRLVRAIRRRFILLLGA